MAAKFLLEGSNVSPDTLRLAVIHPLRKLSERFYNELYVLTAFFRLNGLKLLLENRYVNFVACMML